MKLILTRMVRMVRIIEMIKLNIMIIKIENILFEIKICITNNNLKFN